MVWLSRSQSSSRRRTGPGHRRRARATLRLGLTVRFLGPLDPAGDQAHGRKGLGRADSVHVHVAVGDGVADRREAALGEHAPAILLSLALCRCQVGQHDGRLMPSQRRASERGAVEVMPTAGLAQRIPERNGAGMHCRVEVPVGDQRRGRRSDGRMESLTSRAVAACGDGATTAAASGIAAGRMAGRDQKRCPSSWR